MIDDHPVIESYGEAFKVCAKALQECEKAKRMKDHEARMARVDDTAQVLVKAQMARDNWMTQAKAAVDAI